MRPGKEFVTTFLQKFDLQLSEGESVVEHLDPQKGMNGGVGSGFVLTDRRLLFVKREWWGGLKSKSVRLHDVDYFDVQHLPRPKSTLIAAVFMFLIGAYLGGATLALTDNDVSSTYVQIASVLLLIGSVVAGFWYRFSEQTMISTEFDSEKITVSIAAAVLDEAEEFRARLFEVKASLRAAA